MVAVNQIVDERVFRYRTEGVDEVRAKADALAKAQGALAKSSDTAAASNAGVEKTTRGTAEAYGRAGSAAAEAAQKQAVLERAQRMMQAAMVQAAAGADAYDRSLAGLAETQVRAAQAAAQAGRVSNDNVAALAREGEAYRSAGKFAAEHPLLVLAGSAAAARGLSGLATSASVSLAAASATTARFAAESAAMGASTATGAAAAARGLGLASTAAGAAAGGLTAYSESVSGLSLTTSLLTRGLNAVPPAIVPIAAAFGVFAVGAAVLEKASADLGRLVDLAQRAEKLDVGATFLKSFTELGPAIRVSADEMQAALQRASTLVQDRLGQQNGLAKALADLQSGGFTGGSPLQASAALESAKTTESRIRVALAAMAELEERGQRLAALDLADKVLGPAFVERLRTGQTSVAKIVADLNEAAGKQLFTDGDATRALALTRAIEDTKRAIDAALAATFNFSSFAMTLNGYWLDVLKTVQKVAEVGNRGVDSIAVVRSTQFERRAREIDEKQQLLARLEASNAASGFEGEDIKTASLREEIARLTVQYDDLNRARAAAIDASVDRALGDAVGPARQMSSELQNLTAAAEQAARNLDGTAASAGNAGSALGSASIKARDFADALRSIQQANPNLAGTLSLVDRIGKINRDAVEGSKGILAQFDAGKVGDGEAQAQIRKLNDEAAASIKALRTEAEKPITGYVREAEIGKLDQLGQSLARAGDRYGEVRQKAVDFYQVQIDKGSPEARGALEQQRTEALGKLDAAYRQNVATARKAAADRASADRGGAAAAGADAYDNALQRSKDQVQEFELQARAADKASEEVHKLTEANRLRRAAASAGRSDEAGVAEAIEAQAAAYARARKAADDAQEAQRRLQEGQRELASEFARFAEDVLLGGTRIGEAFTALAKSLASSALRALLTGEGPLAGILGTAPTERGGVGGVLGGQFNLSSILPMRELREAVSGGSETGITAALGPLLEPRRNAQGTSQGFFSSPLGSGLAAAGTGAAIGYSSQSPVVGVVGGAMAGFMASGGNPVGAVVGAGAGLLGGLLSQSEARKQAQKKLQQELQARREALEQARPQIEQFSAMLTGTSIGNVGKSIADAEAQMRAAAKTASDGGDRALADRLVRDFQAYAARMVASFGDAFNGIRAEVEAGFGVNGPFSTAFAAVQQLGEALKGFVADAGRLSDPSLAGLARASAVQGALSSLDAPRTLSATQTEIARINGTAAGLNQVLKDLGLSAEQAATAIAERTNRALDALRDKFSDDLGRKINDAQNKGYLNDAADLITEVVSLNVDAAAIGGDLGQVQTYFQAAAQKIVDSSQLTGDAFAALVQQFPALNGLVHEFSDAVQDTAASLEAIAARRLGYQDRSFAAGNDSSTEEGSLAAFDRKAMQERAAEVKAGGQALVDLEAAQSAERVGIIAEFARKAADALNTRLKGYAERYFTATTDGSTLGGQLDAYDRKAQQEREDEVRAGGEAIAQLEQTQAAERLKIIADFGKAAADALEQQMQAAQAAFDAFAKNIRTFVDGMRAGASSPLAPKDRLAAAQAQYDAQLALARSGDRTALDGITTYAQNLLDASKAYNASNGAFQATFERVAAQLTALPTQVSAEQFIVNAIDASKTALVTATEAMRASLLAGIQANSPTLVAAALNASFTRLDTSVNGLLDYNEFLAGVGPLATTAEQQYARSIFNQIDANGDGQISRLEAANASSYRVEGFTSATNSSVAASNAILGNQNAILNAQNALASQQAQLLSSINGLSSEQNDNLAQLVALNASINSQNSFIQANTAYTNQALQNQAQYEGNLYNVNQLMLSNLRGANAKNGAPVYAEGGWIRGPGTGTSDSIAMWGSNGEFVVNATSARLHGPLLEAINDNGALAMPAVAMPIPVAGGMADAGAMVAELRALRAEVAALRAENRQDSQREVATIAAGAQHVRQGVDEHRVETRKATTDARQAANKPRPAGIRAA